jgi:hypothetical protein
MNEAGCATEILAENAGTLFRCRSKSQIFSSGAVGLGLDQRNYLFTDPHEFNGSKAASASSLQSVD